MTENPLKINYPAGISGSIAAYKQLNWHPSSPKQARWWMSS
jgi:hypothetical protein